MSLQSKLKPSNAQLLHSILLDIGIALHGGDPYNVIRRAKNQVPTGSSTYRVLETLGKQSRDVLLRTTDTLIS